MKKISIRKIPAIVLSIAVVVSAFIPLSGFGTVTAQENGADYYSVTAFTKDQLKNDGWVSTVTDPSTGAVTQNEDSIFAQGKKNEFWWKFNSDGSIQGQGDTDCENNFCKAYQSLTYTSRKFEATEDFTLKLKTVGAWHSSAAISIGVQNAGDIVLSENAVTIVSNTANKENSEDGLYTMFGAPLGLEYGTQKLSTNASNNTVEWEITVTGGRKLAVTANGVTRYFDLNGKYIGGYVAFAVRNSYTTISNFSLETLDSETPSYDYYTALASISNMEADGWKSAYSENPQRDVAFADCDSVSKYFKNQGDGIIRNEVGFDWQGNHSYGNWKDPFQKMAALTYGAKQYKYFTLSIDYTVYTPGVPWPVISFGQPETTPEMFYHKANAIENPAGGDSAIGLWPELEGSLNITGANVEKKRVSSDKYTDMKQWHTLTLTVMPGEVTVSIDGGAVELTAELSSRYEGGYIALMLGHSYSRYKNISITDYTYLDAVQNSGEEEVAFDFAEGEGVKPVLLNIKPARWYEFDTINVVTADGSEAQINEIKSGFYMIGGATLSSITVKYKKKALDYDPLYAVRYYFDWEEELGDFTALNSENALNTDFTAINAGDRWTVNNGLLKISGATVSDSNLLLIGNRKFRNFELTLEYKHGSNRGFMGGPVFGITDTSKYCTKAGGGIWTMIEADARAMARGLDVKNISDDGRWPSSFEYLIKPWIPNIENYPSQGDKNFNNYTHKLKLRVVEGKAEMWVDDTKDPLTMLIPRDYAGYVGIGVTNNSCSYDNLKIQPLNEFGKPITLEESDRLIENFSLENVEADPWDGDTSEWGDAPVDYFYD